MREIRFNNSQDSPDDHGHGYVEYSSSWNFGPGGSRYQQQFSGPGHLLEDLTSTDETKSLIRWGVFVVTFVPIVVTLIAKAPEIITALAKAFGWGN